MKKKIVLIGFAIFTTLSSLKTPPDIPIQNKIVGLIGVRNESFFIEQCLRALACYTDAIVILDDASDDDTVAIVESLQEECNIERIIKKKVWYRDEPGDRNKLLAAGREIGGTHFICIDADEMLTANCMKDNRLREYILDLAPGDTLSLFWIQLWRGIEQYRFDNSVWTYNTKEIIFCDDGTATYTSEFIHTKPVPHLTRSKKVIQTYQYGLLHFQFVNWQNLLIKQAWYRCLERIRLPEKPVGEINRRYAATVDEKDLKTRPALKEWFQGYNFFDPSKFEKNETWRTNQIQQWFATYETNYFKDLDIWNIDWNKITQKSTRYSCISKNKIVGLIQVKNEEAIIEQCLRGLAEYTDAIVIVDDASEDKTKEIIYSLAQELNIEKIIENKESAWETSSELDNRTKLLRFGRAVGGTHFITIDADELFSAECKKENWLRNTILSLEPGQALAVPMVNLWGSATEYRNDEYCNPFLSRWIFEVAFCDDKKCSYHDNPTWGIGKNLHVSRFPFNLQYQNKKHILKTEKNINHSLLHFKCVNSLNVKIKRYWYLFLEYIRATEREDYIINKSKIINELLHRYKNISHDFEFGNFNKVKLSNINKNWLKYPFFDKAAYLQEHRFRLKDIKKWVHKYSREFFNKLQLTSEDWCILKMKKG